MSTSGCKTQTILSGRFYRAGFASLATLGLIGGSVGCSVNPATGERQLNTMSLDQEIALGTDAMPTLVEEYGGAVDDPVLTRYVNEIGAELATYTEAENPDLPWEFTLLDSEVINAFALPGGKVFISRGLMQEMTNEAQLAGVLGHEIGHVTARHVSSRISEQMLVAGLGAVIVGTAEEDNQRIVGLIVGVGGNGFLLSFGREDELQADNLGMRYMSRAGYDPAGQLQVMHILDQAQQEAGGGSPPELLSTHPLPKTRIERIQKKLRGQYAYTQNSPEYSLHEERFQQIAAPRLAARRGVVPADAMFASAASWCAHCREDLASSTLVASP